MPLHVERELALERLATICAQRLFSVRLAARATGRARARNARRSAAAPPLPRAAGVLLYGVPNKRT